MTRLIFLLGLAAVLVGCVQHVGMSRPAARARAEHLAETGRKAFRNAALSGSGKVSCATCHVPERAFGPPDGLAAGKRAVPSLRYLQAVPHFTEHFFDEDARDPGTDNGPTGGLTWDGRVDRVRDQARLPLLSPAEMDGGSERAIARRAGRPFPALVKALEAYLQNEREFFPYNSRFDEWMRGKGELTARERRGFELFRDPEKGNCASCHVAETGKAGILPQFTDYGYADLGVPGVPGVAGYKDLGLCGPERLDFTERKEYCGMFRTPSLRNAAVRSVFFHSGAVHSLREAVAFYFERDTKPEKWPVREEYRENLFTGTPFGKAASGHMRVSEGDIDDIVEFLRTLTDGGTGVH